MKSDFDVCIVVTVSGKDVKYVARIRKQASSLTQAGWNVVVIGVVRDAESTPLVESVDGFTIIRIMPEIAQQFGDGLVGPLLHKILSIFQVYYQIRRVNARVYQGKDFTGMLLLAFAGIWRRPIIYDSAELYFERPNPGVIKLFAPILRPLEKLLARRAATVLVTSQGHGDALVQMLGIRPTLIVRNAFKATLYEAYPHDLGLSNVHVVAHSGWLLHGRYLTELIDALVYLPDDVHLLFVGDGPRREEMTEHATSIGVGHRVTITGKVPAPQMISALQQATIAAVLFSSEYPNYHLSLPNKFFEAVAAELPIIAIPIPEVKLMIERYDVGIFCDATPRSIAQAIETALQPDNLKRMQANSKRANQELTWEHEVQKMLDVYQTLLK